MILLSSGGTFALYSLLCRHAKFNLLPNQQAADEELSSYKYGPSSQAVASSPLKRFLEKHKRLRTALLIVVLFGACMVVGDGVLTSAISGMVLASFIVSLSFWSAKIHINRERKIEGITSKMKPKFSILSKLLILEYISVLCHSQEFDFFYFVQ